MFSGTQTSKEVESTVKKKQQFRAFNAVYKPIFLCSGYLETKLNQICELEGLDSLSESTQL